MTFSIKILTGRYEGEDTRQFFGVSRLQLFVPGNAVVFLMCFCFATISVSQAI
jgi:hypothetical protein